MDEPRPDDKQPEKPDQPAKQPEQSEQQPVDISADVEALLAEASALADQIAEDTGTEVDADASPSMRSPDALDAEPKAAVDDVEAKLAELESLVNEAAADGDSDSTLSAPTDEAPTSETDTAIGSEAESPPEREDNTADAAANADDADADSGFDTDSFETESAGGDENAEQQGEAGESSDSPASQETGTAKPKAAQTSNEFADEVFDESLVGDIEVSLDESIMDEPEDFGLDAGESKTAAVALRKPMAVLKEMPKRVLAALKKTSGRAIFQRIGDTIVFRTIWAALAIIDRPFAGLSPTAKKYIGIIGIITIICGILSLVLPGMLASNPYLDMVTNP